ncbi:hypothetical protein Dpep_0963 [Dethiosulfovibrio peptidovorans DSM 11002]|uniref:Uncharacterized protein n=1 Tax=Dethiosulfovibrio peptidovorans DSM 11002 TaxID=469381 RepID=D2Z692_9BACT|nr:hypothetical protein [Dethiosulfovibrio peptidovorans]EFC90989.1 hypothetical protein Dpep_0963 [Dethiosulfovibrio peptidovorans DSM 11002]
MGQKIDLSDLVVFGKIVSLALLFGGYVLMGLYLGRYLMRQGYPDWTLSACTIGGTIIGILHGVYGVKDVLNKRGEKKG